MNHPNILTVYEIGQTDSIHFISTEYIEGETLRHHLSSARMTLNEVLDICIQVTNALARAHQAGIIHRDEGREHQPQSGFCPVPSDEQARRRLDREAKSAAKLDHPNICSIYEVGEDQDRSFIVKQYVEVKRSRAGFCTTR